MFKSFILFEIEIKMISVALTCLEIVLIVAGLALLYWWTNKEAIEAGQNLQKAMPVTEDEYLQLMTKSVMQSPQL